MTASLVTPQNAPRDLASIEAMGRAIKYRLALQLGVVSSANPEQEKAFTAAPAAQQAEAILASLLASDKAQGVQQQHPTQPPHAATTTVPATGVIRPQPAAAPVSRQPQTQSDPNNNGSARSKAAAAVGPNVGPAGQTQTSPDFSQMLAVIGKVWDRMEELTKSIEGLKNLGNEQADQLVTFGTELVKIQRTLTAADSIQQLSLGLLVETAGASMGLDRASTVKIALIAAEEAADLLPKGDPQEGK